MSDLEEEINYFPDYDLTNRIPRKRKKMLNKLLHANRITRIFLEYLDKVKEMGEGQYVEVGEHPSDIKQCYWKYNTHIPKSMLNEFRR